MSRRTTDHYRPALDGLRTVAVYLVVAFHAGLGVLSGGFIGVDVFFVLSGFLVTQLLIRDLAAGGGIRLRHFYARRARRILPAAVLTLVGTALVYAVVASPSEMADAVGGFRAASVYVANWYFIRQSTDYFAANINGNPVLHFWSLAVEEQFYIVWPLLLGGLFVLTRRFGRWRWWALRSLVVAAGAASAIAALHIGATNLDRAYYGTDTRAYQLLAGAALALTPSVLHWRPRLQRLAVYASSAAVAALLVFATSWFQLSPITRGVVTAAVAVVLIAGLENAEGGLVERVLSSRVFAYLGRISYGVYLWHWPVIVIASHGRSLPPLALFAISCAIATPLAAISFHLVEHRIRVARRLNGFTTPVVAFGLATSILCGVVVMPAILDRGRGSVSALAATGTSASSLRLLDWRDAKKDIPRLPDCLDKPADECTIVKGTGLRVVLMGDSNAQMWIPAFVAIARERSWTLSVLAHPTCPWQEHLDVLYTTFEACKQRHEDWYARVIPALRPDLVILSEQAFDNPQRPLPFVAPDGTTVRPGTPRFEPTLTDTSSESLRALGAPDRRIEILEPIPDAPLSFDPLACLSLGRAPARCSYAANAQTTPLERFFRAQASQAGRGAIDLARVVCPRWPTCDPIIDDVIVKRDANHVTATFAQLVAPKIDALIPK